MKNLKKVICVLLTVLMMTGSLSLFSFAAGDWNELTLYASDNPSLKYDINVYNGSRGEMYAFLPMYVPDGDIVIRADIPVGSVTGDDLVSFDAEQGIIVCRGYNGASIEVDGYPLSVMKGSLPSMDIRVGEGHTIGEIHRSRDAKIPVTVGIDGAENEKYDLAPTVAEMKTRGYSTWGYDKKPYQIKFDKKQDLFGMGKAKKWILLANYLDGTAVRNKVVFDLGEGIGCRYTSKSVFIDLYINGDYVGVYQLTEKVEIGSSRIDLTDEFGVVLEMDLKARLDATDIYFTTGKTGKAIVFKDYVTDFEDTEDPEVMEKAAEVKKYVKDYINRFERYLYSKDTDWETLSSMIDVDSFARFFLITEFTEEVDATFASTFFYMDGKEDVLHCEPLWDYDRCFGLSDEYESGDRASFLKNITVSTDNNRVEWFKHLFSYKEFAERVNEIYDESAKEVFSADHVNGLVDKYQAEIWDSLMMNYTKWRTVFLFVSTTANRILANAGPSALVEYVTDYLKDWIEARSYYLETAFGKDVPVIRYCLAGSNGVFGKPFGGGSLTEPVDSAGGMKLWIDGSPVDGGIDYSLIYSGKTYTASDGEELIPESGHATGFSAVLTGNLKNYYMIQYRVVQINGRAGAYTATGRIAGTATGSFTQAGIKSVEVRLIRRKPLAYSDMTLNVLGEETVVTGVTGNTLKTEDPQVDGYVFEGWYGTPDFDGEPVAEPVYGTSERLYAKMREKLFVSGDADGDGNVNMKDILLLRKFIAGAAEENEVDLAGADVNGDGAYNMQDILKLRRIIAGAEN